MDKKEQLDGMLLECDGVLLTCDVVKAGISKTYLMEYVRKLNLKKVAQGMYLAPDAWPDYLYLQQIRYPKLIYSHETALYLWGMAEREPLQFTMTANAGYHAKSMDDDSNIRLYRVKKELLDMGVTQVESPFGHTLRVYDVERTICDLVRSRSQVEFQELQGALKEYVRRKKKNLPLLMRYAKELRVERILRQYLEVLL